VWYIGITIDSQFGLTITLVLAGIPALVGALFLTDWVLHKRIWS